jgi:hypothetical protein
MVFVEHRPKFGVHFWTFISIPQSIAIYLKLDKYIIYISLSVLKFFPAVLGPEVYPALNRNESQRQK